MYCFKVFEENIVNKRFSVNIIPSKNNNYSEKRCFLERYFIGNNVFINVFFLLINNFKEPFF